MYNVAICHVLGTETISCRDQQNRIRTGSVVALPEAGFVFNLHGLLFKVYKVEGEKFFTKCGTYLLYHIKKGAVEAGDLVIRINKGCRSISVGDVMRVSEVKGRSALYFTEDSGVGYDPLNFIRIDEDKLYMSKRCQVVDSFVLKLKKKKIKLH
jgi:hypothetical protein